MTANLVSRRQFLRGAVTVGAGAAAVSAIGSVPQFMLGRALAANTYTVPTSIAADGSIDVSAQLSAFLSSVPNSSIIEFPTGAVYLIEQTVAVTEKYGWEIHPNGATLRRRAQDNRGKMLVFYDGGDLLIREGLVIDGPHPSPGTYASWAEGNAGLDLEGVLGAVIERVVIRNTFGDGVYLGSPLKKQAPFSRWCEDIQLLEPNVSGTGRQGVSFIGVRRATVQGGTLTNIARTIFDCEPTGPQSGAVGVRIAGTTTGLSKNGWLNVHGAAGTEVGDFSLEGNTMTVYDGVKPPINLKIIGRGGVVSTGNHFKAAVGPGDNGQYQINGWHDVSVNGDTWEFPRYGGKASRKYGVELSGGCTNVRIINNAFTGAAGVVLDDDGTNQYVAEGNTL